MTTAFTAYERQRLAALERYETVNEARLHRLTHLAAHTFGVPCAFIVWVDREHVTIASSKGLSSRLSRSLPADLDWIDLDAPRVFHSLSPLFEDSYLHWMASAPLKTIDGFPIGIFAVADTRPRSFSETQLDHLNDFAALTLDSLELQRLSHADVQASEAELRSLLAAISDVILIVNSEGRYLSIAPTQPDLLYKPPQELIGKTVHDIFDPPKADFFLNLIHQAIATQQTVCAEYSLPIATATEQPQEVWFRMNLSPLSEDAVFVISHDISIHKQTEIQLQRSLQEKDCLLKEVHHRVKNNLQLISSLLDLQQLHLSEPLSIQVLTQCQSRIQTIALLHQKLYQGTDLNHIDMSSYIQSLVSDLQHLCQISSPAIASERFGLQTSVDRAIEFRVAIDKIYLDINRAIPCGLIINELVLNALKHGYPTGDRRSNPRGTIDIALGYQSNGTLKLEVKNDGLPFSAEVNWQTTQTLGLRLLQTLARQMQGTVQLRSRNPVCFVLEFPHAIEEC